MLQASLAILAVLASGGADVSRTLEGEACAPWARIDVLEDTQTRFGVEAYRDATAHKQLDLFGGGVVTAFGSKTPPPRFSLLHHAPAPKQILHPVPVLLVHGVGTDATLTWFATNIGGERGLVPDLVERGHRVFAVTFAVSHGDSISHAVHLAHAIERVRALTGAGQVDVVAHSMGGLAARACLVRLKTTIPKLPQGAVRRLVLVATPNLGLDLSFRHPRAYTWFGSYGFPSPWTREGDRDTTAESLFGGAYRGHLQMAADLRRLHPLSKVEERVTETYAGRDFAGNRSPGVKAAIKRGGGFIKALNKRRLPKGVEVYLLAGKDNRMRYYDHQNQKRVQVGEYDGPSDGLVFVASALGKGKLKGVAAHQVLDLPHFELTYAEPAKATIARWLD